MNLGGMEIELHWLWLIAAALLASAEIIAPGIFLIFLAAAAAFTGLGALLGVPFAFQLALFPLLALASAHFGRRWYADRPITSSDPLLNDRAARIIGETVVVVAAIEHGSGRVKVGDSVWAARGDDAEAGSRVRVIGVEGTCLRVEPVTRQIPSAD
ncbi:MAG TPA: NfeD family protein [Allosphingosinicella sp.]|nr:NfeD family protein [Allosphingosinicella sp.]